MPLVEVALICVLAGGAFWALARGAARTSERWAYGATLAILVGWQAWTIGPHWQMLPVWAAGLVLAVLLVRRPVRTWRMALSTLALALCALAILILWLVPVFSLPKPTGSYAVGTTGALNWVDRGRPADGETGVRPFHSERELALQLWYPVAAGTVGPRAVYARLREVSHMRSYEAVVRTNSILDAPVAAGQFPVLIFGHRWGGSRTQDTFLAEELASHGYIVVAVDHPLNAARVQLADGSVVRSDRADALSNLDVAGEAGILQVWARELDVWTADDEFVLDRLERTPGPQMTQRFAGHMDWERVGAFGHSFGGAVSLRLLGVNPRVHAAVNLDGWTFQALDRRTTQPVLLVYEGSEQARPAPVGVEGRLNAIDNAAVDRSLARFGGLRLYVAGTQHLDFTDQTLLSPLGRLTHTGPLAGRRAREITRGLVVGFFDKTLKDEGSVPAYPEVKVEAFAAR